MTTVLLVRHGLTAATGHALAGWTPGIPLDDRGRAQAQAVGERLARLPLDAIISSPLERCRETAGIIAAARADQDREIRTDERLGECRYGDWTGRPLRKLAKEPLWRVVQAHPSAVRFPGPDGESMLDTQHRAVAAVREWNAVLGARATYLICSHGDVIKGIIADCLGLHLDLSQRIQADPCSLTVIRYTALRPFLVRMNDVGGGIEDLMPRTPDRSGESRRDESDAVVGGGAGAGPGHGPEEAQNAGPAVRERIADARG
ncbi:MAG: MSMEG_4193 family putative phosphomutase [Streptosporangiaceae bacterium]